MKVREIILEDAEQLINLVKQVESESTYMLMESGERKTTPEQQQKYIELILQQRNSTIFVAENELGKLVGYLMVVGGNVRKKEHSVYLVIGILEAYSGQGIGTSLFQQLEKWANERDISRIELTVVTENAAALALYKKSGFQIEGTKRQSLKVDAEFYDEYYMAKIIKN